MISQNILKTLKQGIISILFILHNEIIISGVTVYEGPMRVTQLFFVGPSGKLIVTHSRKAYISY